MGTILSYTRVQKIYMWREPPKSTGRVRDQATAGRLSRGESHPVEARCFQGGSFWFGIFFEQLRRAAAHFFCQIEKVQAGTKVQFSRKSPSSTKIFSSWRPKRSLSARVPPKITQYDQLNSSVVCIHMLCTREWINNNAILKPSLKF